MIQYLSLFSGIGAFEKALNRLGVPYNLVNYCEIDKYASKSYSVVHDVPESLNLGDITKVKTSKLPQIDMISYGFPCQDISIIGKMQGLFNKDNTLTRSGLFFEALRIIEDTKPMVAIAENVKNLTSKKFNAQFQIVLESLEQAGYNNYWQVLNAKGYGIPQNRERVFIVSIRKDIDTGNLKFPEAFPLELRLKDLLEPEVDEKYYLKPKDMDVFKMFNSFSEDTGGCIQVGNLDRATTHDFSNRVYSPEGIARTIMGSGGNQNDKAGQYLVNTSPQKENVGPVLVGGIGEKNYGTQYRQGNRVYDSNAIAMCIAAQPVGNAGGNSYLYKTDNLRIRKLTPLECWRLMGFDDEDFYKAEKVNSNTQLYKQAGNSIVVDVLVYLFKEIMEVLNVKRVEDKVIVYECDDLINLEKLKEKEPDLYAELLADYPCENATYVFKNRAV